MTADLSGVSPPTPPTTVREHAELILGASRVGFGNLRTWAHFNEEHAQAIIDLLDAAESDLFDEHIGMVALVPDGTVWELRNGIGPWIRTDSPDPLAQRRPETGNNT